MFISILKTVVRYKDKGSEISKVWVEKDRVDVSKIFRLIQIENLKELRAFLG